MAASLLKKSNGTKRNGGVSGAIVPPRKQVDQFPLMTFVSNNCSFDDLSDESLENEEDLKIANNKRVDELLSKATLSIQNRSSTEEDDRKNALEVVRSMELARNQKDTWKFSEPNSQKKSFLHPLKRNDKEDDYFSGIPKVKQTKERKRCRSDEVVLLDNGKLVPKNSGTMDFDSIEVAQLPLKFNLPVRKPRVPSVGLPFTPGPPIPTANNPWLQKSGTQLFSNVQSQTILLNGNEEDDLALAIAESLRTAKEEEQRNVMLKTLFQSQYEAVSTTRCDKPFEGVPPDPIKASQENNSWEAKKIPPTRNAPMSMSVDSKHLNWEKEMSNCDPEDWTQDDNADNNNNNSIKSGSATRLDEGCLNQRPRHSKEQKSPTPMPADFEKSVSHEGTVITLQAPDRKKCSFQKKQSEEKEEKHPENLAKQEQISGMNTMVNLGPGKDIELKQEKVFPKTSHVPETFDYPKITSSRLPTSKPTALMTAMRNFTQPQNESKAQHNYVGHVAKTSGSSRKTPPLLIPPKESTDEPKDFPEGKKTQEPTNFPEGKKIQEPTNFPEAKKTQEPTNFPKGKMAQETIDLPEGKKLETQQFDAGGLNLSSTNSNSAVLEISSNAAPSQPKAQQHATPSSSISLDELSLASAQAQMHYQMQQLQQMQLLWQQSMGCIPQALQNGQNFGGVSSQFSNADRLSESGTAASMPTFPPSALNIVPNKASSPPETIPGPSAGLPNGSLPLPGGLPNTLSPSMSEPPNSLLNGISGFSNTLTGGVPGLTNPYPGIMPGLSNPYPGNIMPGTNPYSGIMPGLTIPYPGNIMPGLANNNPLGGGLPGVADPSQCAVPNLQTLPSTLPDLSGMLPFAQPAGFPGYTNGYSGVPVSNHNLMPPSLGGIQNTTVAMNPLSSLSGMQNNLPSGFQASMSTSPTGMQNCNSFGGMVQSLTPQPGSAPLMGGRGRGRLGNPSQK